MPKNNKRSPVETAIVGFIRGVRNHTSNFLFRLFETIVRTSPEENLKAVWVAENNPEAKKALGKLIVEKTIEETINNDHDWYRVYRTIEKHNLSDVYFGEKSDPNAYDLLNAMSNPHCKNLLLFYNQIKTLQGELSERPELKNKLEEIEQTLSAIRVPTTQNVELGNFSNNAVNIQLIQRYIQEFNALGGQSKQLSTLLETLEESSISVEQNIEPPNINERLAEVTSLKSSFSLQNQERLADVLKSTAEDSNDYSSGDDSSYTR